MTTRTKIYQSSPKLAKKSSPLVDLGTTEVVFLPIKEFVDDDDRVTAGREDDAPIDAGVDDDGLSDDADGMDICWEVVPSSLIPSSSRLSPCKFEMLSSSWVFDFPRISDKSSWL